MKTGIFVTDLVAEEVEIRDPLGIPFMEYGDPHPLTVVGRPECLLPFEEDAVSAGVRRTVVPWTRMCRHGREDVFVAHSPRVERLLGEPYRLLHENIDTLEGRVRALENHIAKLQDERKKFILNLSTSRDWIRNLKGETWWQRLTRLFTGYNDAPK